MVDDYNGFLKAAISQNDYFRVAQYEIANLEVNTKWSHNSVPNTSFKFDVVMENQGVCSFDFTVNAFNNHLAHELTHGAHEARHYFNQRLNECAPTVQAHIPGGAK